MGRRQAAMSVVLSLHLYQQMVILIQILFDCWTLELMALKKAYLKLLPVVTWNDTWPSKQWSTIVSNPSSKEYPCTKETNKDTTLLPLTELMIGVDWSILIIECESMYDHLDFSIVFNLITNYIHLIIRSNWAKFFFIFTRGQSSGPNPLSRGNCLKPRWIMADK